MGVSSPEDAWSVGTGDAIVSAWVVGVGEAIFSIGSSSACLIRLSISSALVRGTSSGDEWSIGGFGAMSVPKSTPMVCWR